MPDAPGAMVFHRLQAGQHWLFGDQPAEAIGGVLLADLRPEAQIRQPFALRAGHAGGEVNVGIGAQNGFRVQFAIHPLTLALAMLSPPAKVSRSPRLPCAAVVQQVSRRPRCRCSITLGFGP